MPLRNPTLRVKLNVIVSVKRLVAFQLSSGPHTQQDVVDFITKVIKKEASNAKNSQAKYLV